MTDLGLGELADTSDAPSPGPRRVKSGLAVLLSLLLICGIGAGSLVGVRALIGAVRSSPSDYSGNGSGSVTVRVDPGDTATEIAGRLAAAGVVKTAGAFQRAAAADQRSLTIQPGLYRLHRHMSAAAALALMLDPTSLIENRVAIPEGSTAKEILALVASGAGISAAQLTAALHNPAALGLPSYANGRPEGFLFPATYRYPPGTTAAQALAAMVTRFDQAAADLNLDASARALGQTPYAVLIIASIVQGEARVPADFPKVARVIYNRLARGMLLQMDSTINYVLPTRKTFLTTADTQLRSPYNTYLVAGLPPTPIGSPGQLALQAALHPAPGSWLYFVTIDKAGHNAFTNSYAEFLRLKAQAGLGH